MIFTFASFFSGDLVHLLLESPGLFGIQQEHGVLLTQGLFQQALGQVAFWIVDPVDPGLDVEDHVGELAGSLQEFGDGGVDLGGSLHEQDRTGDTTGWFGLAVSQGVGAGRNVAGRQCRPDLVHESGARYG